jgi:hypothetical protein
MDPAVAGGLVAAGFTTITAIATQVIAARRERSKDLAARNDAARQELLGLLEPAAAPLAIGAAVAGERRRLPGALLALLGLLAVVLVLLVGIVGAILGLQPTQSGYGPSATARAEIPALYLRLYTQAGARYGIDPWVLAGIGAVESDHGRSTALGVRSGVNAFGCCAGPMQFSIAGKPSTWDR